MVRLAIAMGAVGAAALLASAGSGCDDGSHVYEGRQFVEGRGCYLSKSSLDVVSGEPAGECQPRCLVQRTEDGGRAVYGATMCPPLPFGFDVSGTDPICPIALAALERGDFCLPDGGSTKPLEPLADAATD